MSLYIGKRTDLYKTMDWTMYSYVIYDRYDVYNQICAYVKIYNINQNNDLTYLTLGI
jgi:hypothetical protein